MNHDEASELILLVLAQFTKTANPNLSLTNEMLNDSLSDTVDKLLDLCSEYQE